MQIKTLYRYKRADGGITVSPNKPECEYTELFRVVADVGMAVTNDGQSFFSAIDTYSAEGWYEVSEGTAKG